MNKTTYCFDGKAIGKLLFTLLFFFSINNMFSQTTIVSDGLNNSTTLFTLSGGAYYTGNSATGDRVASSPFAVEGTHSYGLNAPSATTTTATMTTSNINTSAYTGISATFRLAAFSIGSTNNGMDGTDIVTVSVSPDGGTTYYSTVRVLGNGNAYWSYSGGTGVASTAYDGNATSVDFTPAAGGNRTTDGYSTVTVTGLPAITNLRVRITMTNNATSERWVVDDFKITGTLAPVGPEINVQGNSTNIVSGDTTPSTADHTDFGSVNAASGSVVRTFTIQNTGTAALNISSAYLLDGASGFSITSAPASSVAASGSTTIQVTFDPASAGTFSDEVVIESDDANEGTYTFAITGVGFVATPEINVQGNSVSIVDGDITPSTADHTDFGSVTTSSGSVVRTFTIQNTGTGTLTLDATPVVLLDGTHFTVTAQPSSTTVAPSGSVTFQVTFDPSVSGTLTDTVLIGSDDADEGVYTFDITGFGIAPQPEINVTGNAVSIVSGDVTPALADHTDFGSVGATSSIVRTYTIQNTGDAPLVLGSPAVLLDETDGFSITQQPTSPVGVGSSTTFQITFTPSVAGVDTNTVLIDSNDANEGTYSFAITGTGTVVAPVATAATSVGTSSFTAHWNAVAGATNYELDVYTLTGGTTEVINQTFTWSTLGQTNGTGGNSGGWSGTIATETFDISGWTDVAGYRADNCAKMGAGSTRGSITTPVFGLSGDAVVTFRAGAWNGGSEQTTLLLEITGGGTLSASSVTMVKGAFSNYSVNVTGATASTQVTFRAFQVSNARFFIDDINVVVDNLTKTPVSGYNGLLVGNNTSYNVTGLDEGTTYYYVVRAISGSVETANSNEISATTGYAPVTWTGGAWSNVSGPTNLIDAIIEDVYVTADDGEFTAKSLTVTTGGSLTVSSGDVVTVVGALDNELTSSAVVVENNGVLMQGGTSNLNTGSITVRRNSSAILRQDYTLWSSPVAGQGLYAFSPTTLPNRFYTYNTSTNLYSNSVGFNLTGLQYPTPLVAPNGINGTDENNVQFATAKGYLIRTPWNHPTAPTAFAGQFAGVPNSGDITYTMSLAGTGFNLVGNPYPSPIDMETFVGDNATNITTSLYFWRETNGSSSNNAYCQWNDGLFQSNGQSQVFDPQNVIRTGQGFFVEATGAGTALVFNNGQRVADTANQFFRQNNTQDVYWLNLTNSEGAFSQAVVSYKDYASNGVDRYDGKNVGTSQVSLTSIVEGQEYGIQGKATFVDTDVVPMHLKVETTGTYSIAIDRSRGVFATGQTIYLKDNLLSSLHNLSQGAYSFTSEAGSFATRFEVVYRDSALGVDTPVLTEKQVVVYKNQVNDFVITTGNFEMGTVKVFDVRGRLLVEKQNINATQTTLTAGLSNEVLLVQIATTDGTVVTKKVVR